MELSDKLPASFIKKLRVLPYKAYNGIENMAMDLFYADWVANTGVPLLRFYGWKPFCLSLGRHQTKKDVHFTQLVKDGYDIVLRPTGGSAIFHSEELTYSFIIPRGLVTHQEMYNLFHTYLAYSLNKLGYKVQLSSVDKHNSYLNKGNDTFACFNRAAQSEIQFAGKKVVGSAQKIFRNSILQHGSVILTDHHSKIISYLNVDAHEQALQRKILKSKAISLAEISDKIPSKRKIMDILIETFHINGTNEIVYQYPTPDETKSAKLFNKIVDISNK